MYNTMGKLHLNTAKLDSFRLLIPSHKLKINPHHHTFLQQVGTINIHGEIIDDFAEKKNYYDPKAPVSFTYQKAHCVWGKKSEEVIKIGISAKALREDYMEGITEDNLYKIVEQLNREGVILEATTTLLKSARIYDVDFCVDMHLGDDLSVSDVVSMANKLTIPRKEVQVNVYDQEKNRGIQWGFRNKVGKGYKTKQFLKYYDKITELINRSEEFYKLYLTHHREDKLWEPNKILRSETTIKDPAHFKSFDYKITTLGEAVALLNDPHIYKLWDRPINYYMTGKRFLPVNMNLMPRDYAMLDLMNSVMAEHQISRLENVVDLMCDLYSGEGNTKHHRYNFKKQLEGIIAKVLKAEEDLAAKSNQGQYQLTFEKGLTPHHDRTKKRPNPLRPPANAPVGTTRKTSYIIGKPKG